MKNKPLIFSLLTALCLIEPLIKVLYFKATTHFDFGLILANLVERNRPSEIVDFWFVFPVAGLLILKLRRWTYAGFMALMAYNIYKVASYEAYTWPYNGPSPFLYDYLVLAGCSAIFVWFLFPNVRRPFFDQRVRWWETTTRYPVAIACRLENRTMGFNTLVSNISKTGLFVRFGAYLENGTRFNLELDHLGLVLRIPVEVVHRHSFDGHEGYGLRFVFNTWRDFLAVNMLVGSIKKNVVIAEPKMKLVA